MKQQDETDCGVACLSMILKYYGGYANMERIRQLTHTTNKGTSAYDLIEAAKQFGFHAWGIKTTLNEKKRLQVPFIAHLKVESYHYVVVYQINSLRETLTIADPAFGVQTISFREFQKKWTNIAILFYPIHPIERLDVNTSFFTFLYFIVQRFKKESIRLCCFSIMIGFYSFCTSFFTKWMFDAVEFRMEYQYFYVLFFSGACIYLLLHVTTYVKTRLYLNFNHKLQLFLTSNVLKRLLSQPQQYYQHRTVGELLSRIEDLPIIQNFLGICYQFFSFDLVMFILSLILLYRLNIQLFQIEMMLLVFYLLLFRFTYQNYQNKNYKVKVKKASVTTVLSDLLLGLNTIQGIHIEKKIHSMYLENLFSYFKKDRSYQIFTAKYQLLQSSVCDIVVLLQLLIGGILIMEDRLSIGNLLLFELLSGYLVAAISKFHMLYIYYGEAKNAYDRISYLLLEEEENSLLPYMIQGNITFHQLIFSYQEDQNLLNGISLSIRKGEKILLLGVSGSGKSTLLKLLMKYEKVKRDMIYFDGVDICDIRKEDLKRAITYVPQKGVLFSGTLYQNILMNRVISPQTFSEVLKLCDINSILKKYQLGMHTMLDDNSNHFSGGERQRIILARALLNSYQILLLDEATNQLDEQSEYQMLRLLFWKYPNKTVIVISHRNRMENHYLYNRILELKDGVLKEICFS